MSGQNTVALPRGPAQPWGVQSPVSPMRHILIVLLLPFLVMVVFWPATRNQFVNYDDPRYVLSNSHVQSGLTVENLRWAFTTGYAGNWHPLTWISHMADCQLFGLNPSGHHATSVLLHAINTLLVYLALRALTGSTWRSLCVALLFGLHPLRVESVAWVSERKDVLSTLFWMATLWAYAEWSKRSLAQQAGTGWFYALTLLFFVLGLMSKPMLVTMPFVLLLLDYWPLRRWRLGRDGNSLRLIAEKLPFFALAVAACVVTYLVQRQWGSMKDEESLLFSARLANAVVSYVQYLGHFFWPAHLAVFYPHPGFSLLSRPVLLAAAILLLLTGMAIWQWRERPWLPVGWFWYLGTLVPTIGLVQVGQQAMADRYTYVPMLGVAIALVWTLHELMTHWRVSPPLVIAGTTACCAACVAQTRLQIGYWETGETLFRHAVTVTENNVLAHLNLGAALQSKGDIAEATSEFESALEIEPDSAVAHLNLGVILDANGRSEEALPHLLHVTQLEPERAEGHFRLGMALLHLRRGPEALEAFEQTLRLQPNHPDARRALEALRAARAGQRY